MSQPEEFLCARCARHQKTCCQNSEVYVSLGDLRRIAAHTGQTDFFQFQPAGRAEYADQDDDPTWRDYVFRSDGTRRVLKQHPNGDCVFLGPVGCVMPYETRPLACRLYPHDYTDQGLLPGNSPGCPLELLAPGQTLFETLNMSHEIGRRWHQQLYHEILWEKSVPLHIGLVFDLRSVYLAEGYSEEETAEFDRADTIDHLEQSLRLLGHEVDRIGHARQLVQRLAAGDRWDLVFNFAEGLHGLAREAQVPAILDLYQIPYTFSDPLIMALSLHKGLTKTVVREAGIPTPDFYVVSKLEDIALVNLPFPLFAKPIGEGTGKGVSPTSKIADRESLEVVCRDLLVRFKQPVLVETYLPGREFTVGILGTGPDAKVLGTLEIILRAGAEADVYSYVNKERCEELVAYPLVRPEDEPAVREAEELALAAWRALNCRDGGRVDLRCDAQGRPKFLEVNPLAGLHPQHSDLPMLATAVGMPFVDLIGRIVDSARTRIVPKKT